MMDYLASMYIDNELDLDEKIQFVDKVYSKRPFYEDTRALLLQEKLLRTPPDTSMLPVRPPMAAGAGHWFRKMLKPMLCATAGFAAAGLLLFSLVSTPTPAQCFNRFVIYEPAARQVELAGSFTGWTPTPMQPVGNSGYWELNLQVPSGEHRFAYILDGSRQMADPTLPGREMDDFGGTNSILNVKEGV
jgi:hypothetical protein